MSKYLKNILPHLPITISAISKAKWMPTNMIPKALYENDGKSES
jgi:hypothetical protein